MALSSSALPYHLSHLAGYLTTREAAVHLNMSYWHFMHLVEDERIHGIRILDRWLFTQEDLDVYRRSTKSGEILELARTALSSPHLALTPRQHAICEALTAGSRPADIARQQNQTRQAVHAQIALIREKMAQAPQITRQNPRPRRIAPPPSMAIAPLME